MRYLCLGPTELAGMVKGRRYTRGNTMVLYMGEVKAYKGGPMLSPLRTSTSVSYP